MPLKRWICAAACLLAGGGASLALAEPAARWSEPFATFADSDLKNAPPEGGVLFVGSSSIRLWDNLEDQFEGPRVVIKRGFGGSRLTDCVENLDRLVIRYKPRLVLLYAGDNDLAEGGSPEDVLARFTAFADGVHAQLPETQVAFISIKPSPARLKLIPQIRAANKLVRGYVDTHPGVEYVDVFTPMLSADGAPRAELFRKDELHLNDQGYALWRKVILPYVH